MNDTLTITIGTSDRLQKLLEGFFRSNKSLVVVIASASSPNELQIYFESLRYGEIERTWLQKP